MIRDAIPRARADCPETTHQSSQQMATVLRSHLKEKAAWIAVGDLSGAVGYPGHIQTPQIVMDALWYLQDVGLAVVERGRWATTERVVRGEWKSSNECSTKVALR